MVVPFVKHIWRNGKSDVEEVRASGGDNLTPPPTTWLGTQEDDSTW